MLQLFMAKNDMVDFAYGQVRREGSLVPRPVKMFPFPVYHHFIMLSAHIMTFQTDNMI